MAAEKRQITRSRTSYSCQTCRRRKVKCDKVHPVCGACLRANEQCNYGGEINVSSDPVSVDGGYHVHARKRREVSEGSRSEDQVDLSQQSDKSTTDDHLKTLGTLLQKLSSIVNKQHENLPNSSGRDKEDNDTPSQRLNERSDELTDIAAQLQTLNLLLQPASEGLSLNDGHGKVYSRRSAQSSVKAQSISELFYGQLMPSSEKTNVLFRNWLTSVYPVLPIVDLQLTHQRYLANCAWFASEKNNGGPIPFPDFLPMTFTIFYGGIASCSFRSLDKWWHGASRKVMMGYILRHYEASLQRTDRRCSETIAAEITMQYLSRNTVNAVGEGEHVAGIVRYAQSASLHRPRLQKEVREQVARRIWSEIDTLDVSLAAASNIPPMINYQYAESVLPSDLKDDNIGAQAAMQYEAAVKSGSVRPDAADDPRTDGRSSMISVYNLVARTRSAISVATRDLLCLNIGAKPMTKNDLLRLRSVLGNLDDEIRAAIARIPTQGIPEFDFTPVTGKPGQSVLVDYASLWGERVQSEEVDYMNGHKRTHDPSSAPMIQQLRNAAVSFHKWARITLSLMSDQLHCLSYAPFLRSAKSKMWTVARQCALRHSHSFLRKMVALATDLELERFRWTWPLMYQPMHAAMILLVDLFERPFSLEAAASRALFDALLAINNPKAGIVAGKNGITIARPLQEAGEELYGLILSLRAKAWQKAGLDPSFLWDQTDQIRVGVARPPDDTQRLAQTLREDRVFDDTRKENPRPSAFPLYKSAMQMARGELYHPSQAGVLPAPDPDDGITSRSKLLTLPMPVTKVKLVQARPDQERLTPELTPEEAHHWQHGVPDDPDPFHDVEELIKKIRATQSVRDGNGLAQPGSLASNGQPVDLRGIRGSSNERSAGDTPSGDACHYADLQPMLTVAYDELNNMEGRTADDPRASIRPEEGGISRPATLSRHVSESASAENDVEAFDYAAPDSMQLDFDFDWDRWDAVFGPVDNLGFENMLSDDADKEAMANAFEYFP